MRRVFDCEDPNSAGCAPGRHDVAHSTTKDETRFPAFRRFASPAPLLWRELLEYNASVRNKFEITVDGKEEGCASATTLCMLPAAGDDYCAVMAVLRWDLSWEDEF